MTINECYAAIGGDYNATLARLGSDSLIKRLLQKFTADGSMNALEEGISCGNADAAFRAVHTLKGLTLNLGFGALSRSSSALTEQLRPLKLEGYEGLLEQVRADYKAVIAAIESLD